MANNFINSHINIIKEGNISSINDNIDINNNNNEELAVVLPYNPIMDIFQLLSFLIVSIKGLLILIIILILKKGNAPIKIKA